LPEVCHDVPIIAPSPRGLGRKGNLHDPLTEINLTPFVDIALVILLIFLLTATVMRPRTFAIALPRATPADKLEIVPIIISIDREGHLAVNGVKPAHDRDFETVFAAQKQGKEPGRPCLNLISNLFCFLARCVCRAVRHFPKAAGESRHCFEITKPDLKIQGLEYKLFQMISRFPMGTRK